MEERQASEGRDPASPCLLRPQPCPAEMGDWDLELLASATEDSPTNPGLRGQGLGGQRKQARPRRVWWGEGESGAIRKRGKALGGRGAQARRACTVMGDPATQGE